MTAERQARRRKRRRVLGGIGIGLVVVIVAGVALLGISAAQAGLSMRAQAIKVAAPVLFAEEPTDPAAYRAQVLERQQSGPAEPSDEFREKYDVSESEVEGSEVVAVSPKSTDRPDLRVLFLHGGAYVSDLTFVYWDLIDRLVEKTGATVIVPVYPLAPTATWESGHALALAVYSDLLDDVGAENIVIAGDSAGGGFALAIAEEMRDAGTPVPAALVLFSPWLDATLSDPSQPALDDVDPIISIHGLRQAATWWAGDLAVDDPRISPLLGSLDGLPPMAVFTGTDDLLHPDATRLETKAREAGVPLEMYTYENEMHAWVVLFPAIIPEAQRAIDEAAVFIRDSVD